jgi:hypothetical protein
MKIMNQTIGKMKNPDENPTLGPGNANALKRLQSIRRDKNLNIGESARKYLGNHNPDSTIESGKKSAVNTYLENFNTNF